MLGGAALMLADLVSPGIAIPLIAVGIALSVSHRTGGVVSTSRRTEALLHWAP